MQDRFSDRLIVSDLDGTFLGEHETVVARNIEAIRDFQSKGGRFTFATGRTHSTLCKLVPGLHQLVNAPLILLNGTILYDTVKDLALSEFRLPLDPILSLLQALLLPYPSLTIRVLRGDEMCSYHPAELCDAVTLFDCNKIVIVGDCEILDALQEKLKAQCGDLLHTCKSCSVLLELLPAGASKGVLLDKMRTILPSDRPLCVYGIGDYENDLELLAHADVAACPQNAIDAVKQVSARIVCHHTEGAIADLIETIYNES